MKESLEKFVIRSGNYVEQELKTETFRWLINKSYLDTSSPRTSISSRVNITTLLTIKSGLFAFSLKKKRFASFTVVVGKINHKKLSETWLWQWTKQEVSPNLSQASNKNWENKQISKASSSISHQWQQHRVMRKQSRRMFLSQKKVWKKSEVLFLLTSSTIPERGNF